MLKRTEYVGGNSIQLLQSVGKLFPVILPGNVATLYNRANKALERNEYKTALNLLDRALVCTGKPEPNILINKGLALKNLGKLKEAIECYDAAIQADPENHFSFIPWNNKGVVFGIMSKHDEAKMFFEEALRVNPHYKIALLNKGIALKQMGLNDEANKCFDKYFENDLLTLTEHNIKVARIKRQEVALH